ncbi:DEKNAAC102549 [Brettanomyces naardenensis]|uniref:DEKNAAC102549 n=1 Tax=Brettanomyces naardenensis TaxID=13370 RepID=A0A448YLA1_BRENA|nr:DEKNAAC102549 [Brettanomyces naardenensis]
MSTFTAINVSDDELDIEEHTRELQIEHALEVFDEALKCQKSKDYENSRLKLEELFRIEIIYSKNVTNNPTIEQLKYLAYRSRGFFRLTELFEGLNESDEDNDADSSNEAHEGKYEKLISSMNDLATALEHGEADLKLIQLVSELFSFYGLNRLARYGYEYKFIPDLAADTNPNTDDLKWNLSNARTLLPSQLNLVKGFKELLDRLDDQSPAIYGQINKILNDEKIRKILSAGKLKSLDFSNVIKLQEFSELRKAQNDYIVIDVFHTGNNVDLSSLLRDLNGILPKPKGRTKVYDNYILTEVPIDKITFNLVERTHQIIDDPEDVKLESDNVIVLEDTDEVEGNEIKAKSGDESSSRSLNSEDLTPAQRIAAKRLARSQSEASANELAADMFTAQAKFLQDFTQFMKLCDVDVHAEDMIKVVVSGSTQMKDVDMRIVTLQHSMDIWKAPQTESLLVKFGNDVRKNTRQKTKEYEEERNTSIKEILNASMTKVDSSEKVPLSELDNGDLLKLLKRMNSQNFHLEQIRWNIVEHLFEVHSKNGGTLITDGTLNKEGLQNFKIIIDSLDVLILSRCHKTLSRYASDEKQPSGLVSNLNTAVSILEILVDSLLSFQNELRVKKITNKLQHVESQSFESVLRHRIDNWTKLLEDFFIFLSSSVSKQIIQLWIRFSWAKVCFMQHQKDFDTQVISSLLKEMSVKAKKVVDLDVLMVNYSFLPRLNRSGLEVQLSKVKILEAFTNNDRSNQILENILLKNSSGDNSSSSNVESEMRELVQKSPVDLKLRLWTVLLTYYENQGSVKDYKLGFHSALQTMVDEIEPERLNSLPSFQVSQIISKTIGFFGTLAKNYVRFLAKNGWKCEASPGTEDKNVLGNLVIFFKLVYVFLLREDASDMVKFKRSLRYSSVKSYEKLLDISVLTFTLILLYYDLTLREKTPENFNDFYSIMHVQLGVRHICNNAGGVFLEYIQKRLASMLWDSSDHDFFQVVHCRYGIPVSMEDYETFDHESEKYDMTNSDAMSVSKYVIPYCYRKKHPLFNPPRNDIKSILDLVYDTVGDLDHKDATVAKNVNVLTEYLENEPLNLQLISSSFSGSLNIDIQTPNTQYIDVAKAGIYFMQGLMALHLFKIRKKAMQGRSAELDFVIKMFQVDLISGPNKFESWLLLGQAYSYLVEDDIIWTSDKLNNDDKKRFTASVQKQALLCYFMAVSVYCRMDAPSKNDIEPIASLLWNYLGREFYSAWMKPMGKLAFQITTSHAHLLGSPFPSNSAVSELSTASPLLESSRIISDRSAYRIISLIFKEAHRLDKEDWYSCMYLAKAELKQRNPSLVDVIIENILLSCKLANNASSRDDPIVEPHYLLLSVVFKYVVWKKLELPGALKILKQDSIFTVPESVLTMEEFSNLVIDLLRKCISYDKKKWQHKPRYRISRIYLDQLKDIHSCKKEMDSIISLKPTVRSLSTIWKPENERAGKHFVYNFMYISFYVDLLDQSAEIYPLIQLIGKLRKLGSSMVNQIRTFDYAVAKACIMIKKIVGIPPGFLDDQITRMVYSEFVKYSKEFVKSVGCQEVFSSKEKTVFYFLSEIFGFRRMANGFAATGVIDECYHSLYLFLFMPFLEKKLEENMHGQGNGNASPGPEQQRQIEFVTTSNSPRKSPSGPSREKIRVARRDITPYCVQLLGNLRKVLDAMKIECYQDDFLPYDKEIVFSNRDYDDAAATIKLDWKNGGGNGELSVGTREETLDLNNLIESFCKDQLLSADDHDLVLYDGSELFPELPPRKSEIEQAIEKKIEEKRSISKDPRMESSSPVLSDGQARQAGELKHQMQLSDFIHGSSLEPSTSSSEGDDNGPTKKKRKLVISRKIIETSRPFSSESLSGESTSNEASAVEISSTASKSGGSVTDSAGSKPQKPKEIVTPKDYVENSETSALIEID